MKKISFTTKVIWFIIWLFLLFFVVAIVGKIIKPIKSKYLIKKINLVDQLLWGFYWYSIQTWNVWNKYIIKRVRLPVKIIINNVSDKKKIRYWSPMNWIAYLWLNHLKDANKVLLYNYPIANFKIITNILINKNINNLGSEGLKQLNVINNYIARSQILAMFPFIPPSHLYIGNKTLVQLIIKHTNKKYISKLDSDIGHVYIIYLKEKYDYKTKINKSFYLWYLLDCLIKKDKISWYYLNCIKKKNTNHFSYWKKIIREIPWYYITKKVILYNFNK